MKPRLLFLSDRYFPHEVGGAERSLRIVLGELRHRFQVQVVTLYGADGTQSVDGVPVTYLSSLPVPEMAPGSPLQRFARTAADSLRYLRQKTGVSLGQKLALAWCNLYSALFCPENFEHLDEDYPRRVSLAPLQRLLAEARPDLVVCDNTRSILLLPAAGWTGRSLAIVRDLKFSSPRRKVIAHSPQGPCPHCSPNCHCMASLPSLIRSPLVRILFRNQEYRLACLSRYPTVLTTSRFLQAALARVFPRPVEVIPNAVGGPLPEPVPKSGPLKILFVGMLTPNKGPDLLVRAFARLVQEVPEAVLLIAGRSYPILDLPGLVGRLGLESKVRFFGFVVGQELSQLYDSAHIVVCPTRWPEPFGRVPLEAMSHGCLVVASRSGAFPETIADGRTGLLFRPLDEDDLLGKLRQARAALDGPMAGAARDSLERYSLERVAGQYGDLLTQITS